MRKKILFYGNCHLATVGRWLHESYADRFEVMDSEDCGVAPFNECTKNFAVWRDNKETQKHYYQRVHEKIKQADYFIFQAIEDAAIDELQTDYLLKHIVKGASIFVPNPRFFAYPVCSVSLTPFVSYIFKNITKKKLEIFEYLVSQDDPIFEKILFESYESCFAENKNRAEKYSLNSKEKVDVLDVIEKEWKNHLLFGTHNHPIGIYWKELIVRLFELLDESVDLEKIETIDYPNSNIILNVRQFAFFNRLFPNIEIPKKIKNLLDLKESDNYQNHGLQIVQEPLEKHYASRR